MPAKCRLIVVVGVGLPLLVLLVAVLLPGATLADLYPQAGMVKPGQPVHLNLLLDRPWYDLRPVRVAVYSGLNPKPVANLYTWQDRVTWNPPTAGGYGAVARLGSQMRSTAFDVGDDWTQRPRYGFLSDFRIADAGQQDRFEAMARFHLNGLQFYDWMYRHSDHLPPSPTYRDPLGRLLSAATLTEKLDLAHQHGMAAMAYTAIYAAPGEFYQAHPDWGLYDRSGQIHTLGTNFLYLMNPAADSPWTQHLLGEYDKILRELPFDGIHMDQYGFPRIGYSTPEGTLSPSVDVATAMANLIDQTKSLAGPRKAVIFNDVGAWPLIDTAPTTNDAIYIEVWPPSVRLDHLHRLIRQGRVLSGGKPVVLAAYISPAYAPSVLLADAVIFASGGYHIEIGEGYGMLADPYFPKYEQMGPELIAHLRRYYDITVRYSSFLYDQSLQDWTPRVSMDQTQVLQDGDFDGVWPLARQNDRYGVLHLINLHGLEDSDWNSPRRSPPAPMHSTQVSVTRSEAPQAVYLVDPDGPDQAATRLPFTYQDGQVLFELKNLAYWAMVILEN